MREPEVFNGEQKVFNGEPEQRVLENKKENKKQNSAKLVKK
jgi:hypothetical protein